MAAVDVMVERAYAEVPPQEDAVHHQSLQDADAVSASAGPLRMWATLQMANHMTASDANRVVNRWRHREVTRGRASARGTGSAMDLDFADGIIRRQMAALHRVALCQTDPDALLPGPVTVIYNAREEALLGELLGHAEEAYGPIPSVGPTTAMAGQEDDVFWPTTLGFHGITTVEARDRSTSDPGPAMHSGGPGAPRRASAPMNLRRTAEEAFGPGGAMGGTDEASAPGGQKTQRRDQA